MILKLPPAISLGSAMSKIWKARRSAVVSSVARLNDLGGLGASSWNLDAQSRDALQIIIYGSCREGVA